MKSTKSVCTLIFIGFLMGNGVLPIAMADSENKKEARYLALTNHGGYVIGEVKVNWKYGGKKYQEKYESLSITIGKSICLDLSLVGLSGPKIPEGAEVWLSASIDDGQTESCRKSTKLYYSSRGRIFSQKMSGTTFHNNRCKNTDKLPLKRKLSHASTSKACGLTATAFQ